MSKRHKRDLERPSREGRWRDDGEFRVYLKGIASRERINQRDVVLGGIGAAIFDSKGNLIQEVKKVLFGDDDLNREIEIMALIEGLNAARSLELKRVNFFYPSLSKQYPDKQQKIEDLVNKAWVLQRQFRLTQVSHNDVKCAFKHAVETIHSKIAELEVCEMWKEDNDFARMFVVDRCQHRYCISCIDQHVKAQYSEGMVPKCPHGALYVLFQCWELQKLLIGLEDVYFERTYKGSRR